MRTDDELDSIYKSQNSTNHMAAVRAVYNLGLADAMPEVIPPDPLYPPEQPYEPPT